MVTSSTILFTPTLSTVEGHSRDVISFVAVAAAAILVLIVVSIAVVVMIVLCKWVNCVCVCVCVKCEVFLLCVLCVALPCITVCNLHYRHKNKSKQYAISYAQEGPNTERGSQIHYEAITQCLAHGNSSIT